MNNELFLHNYQNIYPALKYFSIENNHLILNINNTIYKMPLTHINLSLINPNIYSLNPIELFQTLYLLELLYKPTLNEQEIKFITDYVNKYMKLNDLQLSNEVNYEERRNALSIPIYSAYDDFFNNSPCANIIRDLLSKHSNTINKDSSKGPRLVLTNPNFQKYQTDDDNDFNYIGKSGFTVITLILGAIILTITYIVIFIKNH